MEKYYYTLNKRFEFSVQKKVVIITDTYLRTQFSLSGEMTSKILIPIVLKSGNFITIDEIKKLTGENTHNIETTLRKLLERDFVIKYSERMLSDTKNMPAVVGGIDCDLEIIIVTDFYMSQLTSLENAFLDVKNIKFKYIFIDFDEHLFQEVVMLKVKSEHNNVYKGTGNVEQLISQFSNALIVSLRYKNFEKYRVDSTNRVIEEYSLRNNIPVIYGFLSAKNFTVGPLYIPKKTASLNDFILCSDTLPETTKENFSINQLLSDSMMALLINEINWYLFKNVSPLLIDNVRYYSKTLKFKEIRLYRH